MGLERKSLQTTIKSADEATGIVEAYVNTAGVVDFSGDVMGHGVLDKSVETRGKLPKLFWNHDHLAGHVEATKQIGDQQWVKAVFNLKTQAGHDAFQHVASGDVDSWSIGWLTKARHYEQKAGRRVRVLDEVEWLECSPVEIDGASPGTRTLSVKAKGDLICPYCDPKSAAQTDDPAACSCTEDCSEPNCPMGDAGTKRRRRPVEHKDGDAVAETTAALIDALTTGPNAPFPQAVIQPLATYDDHAVVSTHDEGADVAYWFVPYGLDDDGAVQAAKPIPAVLQYVPANPDDAADLALDLTEARRFALWERKAIATRDGAPRPAAGSDPAGYGDPDHRTFPLDRARLAATVAYFNDAGAREAGGYGVAAWADIGRRIATAATTLLGTSHAYDGGTVTPEDGDAGTKARQYARRTTALQTKAGSRNSRADTAKAQTIHDTLVELHPELDCSPDQMPGRKGRNFAEAERLRDRVRLLALSTLAG